jgi:hypothetical protein
MSELPKIKIGRKTYYIDTKLQELRNIKNPHDTEPLTEMELYFMRVDT